MTARLALIGLILAAAPLSLAPLSAAAEPPMATAGATAPLPPVAEPAAPPQLPEPARAPDRRAAEIGAWANDVLAGRRSRDEAEARTAEAAGPRCPPTDGRPHGEVLGEVGTGGYRSVGGVVSQPVGDCGRVTVGISRTEGRFGHRRR
jgi:hypothetical protein